MRLAALFAGIGGIEEGFAQSPLDVKTSLICESWDAAQAVLAAHFDAPIEPDVRTLKALPDDVDILTAGFPCTDLSQAGLMAGIKGEASGLVAHVFRLLEDRADHGRPLTWLVIENVSNMLMLDRGQAMHYLVDQLDSLGYRWAYRVVDSRFTGVPQRRRRVLLVASPTEDPRGVLFADDAGEPSAERYRDDAFGFFRTEGRLGLGWAQDAVPTLKGGSTVGIPSQPGIWLPRQKLARQFVTPVIEDAEAMQGFARGWTAPADGPRRNGPRWKLIGNAVTVGVAKWLGGRLADPGDVVADDDLWEGSKWPLAAWGEGSKVWRVRVSEYPSLEPYSHLTEVIDLKTAPAVTHGSIAGFWKRLSAGNLGRHPGFRESVAAYVALTTPDASEPRTKAR